MKTQRDMRPYYWETSIGTGMFMETDDKSALRRKPKKTIILYRESDTSDGLPFVVVYEWKENKT